MKIINKLRVLFPVLAVLLVATGCEHDLSENPNLATSYVSFEPNKSVAIPTGESDNVDVKVFATEAKNFDRILNVVVDTTSTLDISNFLAPSTVTIPAGSLEGTLQLADVTPIGSGKTIILGILPQEGVDVAATYTSTLDSEGNTVYTGTYRKITITVNEICSKNPLIIEIVTDQWGDETTWQLYDNATGLIIGSGGPYPQQAASGAYPQAPVNFCLDNGNYTFIIYDNPYNDGMDSGYGNGYYRLSKIVDGEEVEIAKNGVFGAFDEVTFSLP